MSGKVLICGASGLFGGQAANAFQAAGWEVRHYQRGSDMVQAARGVDVIVNAMNPPNYHAWDRLIPEITAQVIAAGLATGATVLVPGNVYVYGTQAGPWGPDTPHRPVARKGQIRAAMEASYREASTRGLRVIVLRGGDFLEPQSPSSLWNMVALKGIKAGKVTTLGPAATRRAYAYLPDMARAALALAEARATLPAFADVPFAGLTLSMDEVTQGLARLMGRPMRTSAFAWWAMRLAAPFWELARELIEMRYLYAIDHALDPAPLARLLPEFRLTPLDEILRQEIAAVA